MKKINILIISAILTFSCAQKEASTTSLEKLKNKELKLIAKIDSLTNELKIVEGEISKLDTTKKLPIITTLPVQYDMFKHYVEIQGVIQADKNIEIRPELGGTVKQILVKEGQKVKAGQLLVQLDDTEIKNKIDELNTQLALAITTFERQERLWNQKIGSEMQYLQAKAQKESLENSLASLKTQNNKMKISAPFSGIVDEIHQKKGELAGPSIPFAQLVNINKVYVEGDVSESYLNFIKAGATADLDFPAINFQTKAKINRTSNVINPANRSFKIRINLNNANHMIKPNLISVMKIKDYEVLDAMVVPSITIKKDFEGNYLYIAKKEGKNLVARKVYVNVSKTYNNISMIESGLSLGDQVITEGFSQVVNGALISTK